MFEEGQRPISSFFSVQNSLLKTCLSGDRFTSRIYYDPQGKPFIWLAEPLYDSSKKTTVSAVLTVALYLDEVIESLSQVYPLDMEALLVSGGGEILSYNGVPDALDEEYSSELRQKVRVLRKQLADRESAVVKLDDGERVLASVVRVTRTDWHIYLFQPEDIVRQLFVESDTGEFIIGQTYPVMTLLSQTQEWIELKMRMRFSRSNTLRTSSIHFIFLLL